MQTTNNSLTFKVDTTMQNKNVYQLALEHAQTERLMLERIFTL